MVWRMDYPSIGNCRRLLRIPSISLILRLIKSKIAMSQSQPSQVSQSHSHRGYKLAIVVLLVAVVVLGAGFAFTELPNPILKASTTPAGFTLVHGAVKIPSGVGTPKTIQFRPTTTDTLSTTISSDGNFEITLHSNVLYNVSLQAADNSHICNPNPSTIVPSGSDYTQDFTSCGS